MSYGQRSPVWREYPASFQQGIVSGAGPYGQVWCSVRAKGQSKSQLVVAFRGVFPVVKPFPGAAIACMRPETERIPAIRVLRTQDWLAHAMHVSNIGCAKLNMHRHFDFGCLPFARTLCLCTAAGCEFHLAGATEGKCPLRPSKADINRQTIAPTMRRHAAVRRPAVTGQIRTAALRRAGPWPQASQPFNCGVYPRTRCDTEELWQ